MNSSWPFIAVGCIAVGFGYGTAQPYIYDITASLASPGKATYALALLMTMNYVAILVSPFGVEAVGDISGNNSFLLPFLVNAVMAFVSLVLLLLRRRFIK
jgi:MFS family permease